MSSRQPNGQDHPQHMRVFRPVAWAALLLATATAAAGFGTPAFADPPLPATAPDDGSRPAAIGAVQLPGQAPVTSLPQIPSPTASGPLAARINSSATEVQLLGEQVLELQQQRDQAEGDLRLADANLRQMRDQLTAAQHAADDAAGDALKAAAALPPGAYDRDLQDLDMLNRLLTGQSAGPHPEIAGDGVERAKVAEQNATSYYAAMQAKYDSLVKQATDLEKTRKTKEDALRKLRADNIDAVEAYEREQERVEQRAGAQYVRNESAAGLRANANALKAVQYALAQLGDPYVWAAEGPNSFDCSGLMWASYRSVGYTLPRVARDQYYATRGQSVSQGALLPGDLIFFASGSSWQTVHHVGMYIGNGKMVHAPTTGDVVKISSVWYTRFYAATRIFPGVPVGPTPPPTSKPPTKPKPGQTTKPPNTGGPTTGGPTTGGPTTGGPTTGGPTTGGPTTGTPTTGAPTPDEPDEETTPPADDDETTAPPANEEEATTPPAQPNATRDGGASTESAATPTGTSGS
ncbi:C40 family peptidase [Asanoa sp. NPDC050611]|uniref:C40 family peptidase n=1 Tax=Asanoa sp. NPDC050611 TaxID=3157098 RepID=UPI0033E2C833